MNNQSQLSQEKTQQRDYHRDWFMIYLIGFFNSVPGIAGWILGLGLLSFVLRENNSKFDDVDGFNSFIGGVGGLEVVVIVAK
ncbi:16735_t:CDS:2, partial [Racocetra persica]